MKFWEFDHQGKWNSTLPQPTAKDIGYGFMEVENVPLFSLNDKKIDPDTGERFEFTKEIVDTAIANTAREEEENGYMPSVTIDHVFKGEGVGYYSIGKRVGDWVFGKLRIAKEFFFEQIMKGKFPYRSIRYSPSEESFAQLALLGAGDPEIRTPPLDATTIKGQFLDFKKDNSKQEVVCFGPFLDFTEGEKTMPFDEKQKSLFKAMFATMTDEQKEEMKKKFGEEKDFASMFAADSPTEEEEKKKKEEEEKKKKEPIDSSKPVDKKAMDFTAVVAENEVLKKQNLDFGAQIKEIQGEFVSLKQTARDKDFHNDLEVLSKTKAFSVEKAKTDHKGSSDEARNAFLDFVKTNCQDLPTDVLFNKRDNTPSGKPQNREENEAFIVAHMKKNNIPDIDFCKTVDELTMAGKLL